MNTDHSIPPLRDLPHGRLTERKYHLVAEVTAHDPRFALPTLNQLNRRLLTRATLLAAIVAAIAVPAAAFADQIGSWLGLYDSGTAVPSSAFPSSQAAALARIWAFGDGEIHQLAERDGVTFYAAKNAAGRFCFGTGFATTPSIDALSCEGSDTTFPSANDPIDDFSSIDANGGTVTVTRLAGFATDSVVRVAVLAPDNSVIFSTPVADGLYAAAGIPQTQAAEIVGYDDTNTVVFRRNLVAPSAPQPAVP